MRLIAAISDWLRHLVTLILLAVVLDIVLPGDVMQRYVRTVVGLVIILSLLSPIRVLMQQGFHLSDLAAAISGPTAGQQNLFSGTSGTSGSAVFENDLESTITEEVEAADDVKVQSVFVKTASKADGTPVVTGVNVVIGALNVAHPAQIAQAIQAQVASQMGLSPDRIDVSYA